MLELLDVRVTITGWDRCGCAGRGKVKGGRGGLPCPVCRAMRRVPSLRMEGVVLDSLEVGSSATSTFHRPAPRPCTDAIPFRLELAAS